MDDQKDNQQSAEPVVIAPQTEGVLNISHEETQTNDRAEELEQSASSGQNAQSEDNALPAAQTDDGPIVQTETLKTTPQDSVEPTPPSNQEIPPAEVDNQVAPQPPQNTDTKTSPAQPEESAPQWQYQSGQLEATRGQDYTRTKETANKLISWSAPDSLGSQKSPRWYFLLISLAIIVSVVSYLLTRDLVTVVVICVATVSIIFYTRSKPHNLDYSLGPKGLDIGQKHYGFEAFKSYHVLEDRLPTIQLMPQKKFMLPISVYFTPDESEKIINVLGEHLPYENKKQDLLDRVISKFHF